MASTSAFDIASPRPVPPFFAESGVEKTLPTVPVSIKGNSDSPQTR